MLRLQISVVLVSISIVWEHTLLVLHSNRLADNVFVTPLIDALVLASGTKRVKIIPPLSLKALQLMLRKIWARIFETS